MSVVKLPNKNELDQLIATLTIKLGKKVTQQDVLEACINLSYSHIDELVSFFSNTLTLSKSHVQNILELAEEFIKGSIDEDVYREK